MGSTQADLSKALAGVDASRRVGWARYFEAEEEISTLKGIVRKALDEMLAMAHMVALHDRLPSEGDLLVEWSMDLIRQVEGSSRTNRMRSETIKHMVSTWKAEERRG